MTTSSSSGSAVLAGRVLLLLLAAGAAATGFVVSRRHNGSESAALTVMYACPMHPEVRAPSPDRACPICRMALEREKPRARPAASPGATVPATAGAAEVEMFLLPPGAEIRSSHDIARARLRVGARAIRAPAWFESRNTAAALLHRDDAALLVAGEDALFLPAVDSTRRAPAPIGVRSSGEPPTPWDGATSLVRFRVKGRAAAAPNQPGWLQFAARTRKEIVVPYSAVLRSPTGRPYVLVVGADNRTLTRRPIEIGSVVLGEASVISGVGGSERVVAMNTFFLNAEGHRQRGSAP